MKYINLINKRVLIILLIVANIHVLSFGQTFQGRILEKETNLPIEYVNIGIPLKNIGTVSNTNGEYSLDIPIDTKDDSIKISCIGYISEWINIENLEETHTVFLNKKTYTIDDIIVVSRKTKMKKLGVTSDSKLVQAGFKDNSLCLGYECGILIKNNKRLSLEEFSVNIANCTLDSICYRLNIYKKIGKDDFSNILIEPIYIEENAIKSGNILVSLTDFNITVENDFLVTLENIKSQQGKMLFCTRVGRKSYYRRTSQGKWETAPVGVSFSIKAKTEK